MGLSARDLMKSKVHTVSPDETLADLEDRLLAHHIGGAPVVERGKLVGIVTRSDVVRALSMERELASAQIDFYREYEHDPDAPSEVVAREMEEDATEAARMVAERMAHLRVRDAMIPDVVTVDAASPLRDVARTLAERRIHRVVVKEGEELTGILTALDLVRLIADDRAC